MNCFGRVRFHHHMISNYKLRLGCWTLRSGMWFRSIKSLLTRSHEGHRRKAGSSVILMVRGMNMQLWEVLASSLGM